MWNFGVAYGRDARLRLYRTSGEGRTDVAASLTLPVPAMVHDFALTKTKAVLVIPPIVLPRVPVGLVLGQRSFGESLRFRPELGVNLAVVDRTTGETRWSRTGPFMMFHTVHAWDEGDDVVIESCAYADGTIMRTIEDVMVGSEPHAARAYVDRVRLGPSGRVDRARRSSCPIEFPRVAPSALGGPYRMVYGVAWPEEGRPFLAQPAAIDTATGEASLAALGPQEFAGKCVPVSKARASSESDVWALTLVLDGASRSTELRVLDGADIGAPPWPGCAFRTSFRSAFTGAGFRQGAVEERAPGHTRARPGASRRVR